jgi:hypothetical protein
MLPDPKLSRRFSRRTPHARCLSPDCPFTRNDRGERMAAAVDRHVRRTGHRVEVIESTSVIYAPQVAG